MIKVTKSKAYFPAWQTYTPAVTGSVSNPTLTNKNGSYLEEGKKLTCIIETGPITANGSGYYLWSIPTDYTIDTAHSKISTIADADASVVTLKTPAGQAMMSSYGGAWSWVSTPVVVVLSTTTVGVVYGLPINNNAGTADRANAAGSTEGFAAVAAYFNLQFQVAIT